MCSPWNPTQTEDSVALSLSALPHNSTLECLLADCPKRFQEFMTLSHNCWEQLKMVKLKRFAWRTLLACSWIWSIQWKSVENITPSLCHPTMKSFHLMQGHVVIVWNWTSFFWKTSAQHRPFDHNHRWWMLFGLGHVTILVSVAHACLSCACLFWGNFLWGLSGGLMVELCSMDH